MLPMYFNFGIDEDVVNKYNDKLVNEFLNNGKKINFFYQKIAPKQAVIHKVHESCRFIN